MIFRSDPFLQLVPNRVESAVRRLRDAVWSDRTALAVTGTSPTREHRPASSVSHIPRKPVRIGETWGRLFEQRWFHISLPTATTRSGPRYLEWRDQGEATLHVNGVPFYGFDVAHRRVELPVGARDVWIEGYCCQSAIWHPDATGISPLGSVFGGAFLVNRNEEAWSALHDLQCLSDLMMQLRSRQNPTPPAELSRFGEQPSLEHATPAYRILLSRLAAAIDAFDSLGVDGLARALAAVYREFRDPRSLLRATLTGHAHIDLVWLWPERMGEAKAVHTFATVDRLMSLYPEFRFAYSQPASYRAVERRAPKLAASVAQRMRAGQWQATGAMDVESDTLLPCGEALARSFLLGQDEFRRLRGTPAQLLWLPDVFGYSGCLPQLMRLAGVKWFFTTKLTWNAINRFPYSSFVWRGTDGSEVVAHVTQNAGYNNRLDLDELHANACGHVQADVNPEFLHPTGYGDGGGGPTEEMCERARRLSSLAGSPAIAWDHPESFFQRLERRRSKLPVYQGECYLEYHRGTFTTHGDLKAAFRALERALQVREACAVVRGATPDLTAVWRRLVFAQFHDYIPGSSIAEVYAEGVPELASLARQQIADADAELADEKTPRAEWQAFNPLPVAWHGWLPARSRGEPIWAELAPLASTPLASLKRTPTSASARGRTLSNDRVHAEIDADGWLSTLCIDHREIALTGPAARAVLYTDRPANYDAWDIDRHTLALGTPVATPARIKIEVNRRDRVVMAVRRRLGRASTMTTRYIVNAAEAVLRIEAEIEWSEQHTLLKLHFPTSYDGTSARYGAPFGSVLRGQQPGKTGDEAQWECPGSRWAAVARDGEREGLALICEAKYGFAAQSGDLSVSLLRGARMTGSGGDRYSPVPGLTLADSAPQQFTDQGRHIIKLAVCAYDLLAPVSQQPASLADSLYTTPLIFRGSSCSAGLLGIEGANTLIAAWARPLEQDAWLLRLHEVGGQAGFATISLASGWRAQRCGLDATLSTGSTAIHQLPYRPYEIISLRISRSQVPES